MGFLTLKSIESPDYSTDYKQDKFRRVLTGREPTSEAFRGPELCGRDGIAE